MHYLVLFLVFLSGVVVPVQIAVNTRLKEAVVSPVLSALVSFVVGALVLTVMALSGMMGRGRLTNLEGTPWWAWIGGFCGALVVTAAIIGVPRLGTAGVVAATIFGQLIASLVLDHYGWLGVPKNPVNGARIMGAILLFVGALLMQRK